MTCSSSQNRLIYQFIGWIQPLRSSRFQVKVLKICNQQTRQHESHLHRSEWPVTIGTDAVWTEKCHCQFSKGNGRYTVLREMALRICISRWCRGILLNRLSEFNPRPNGLKPLLIRSLMFKLKSAPSLRRLSTTWAILNGLKGRRSGRQRQKQSQNSAILQQRRKCNNFFVFATFFCRVVTKLLRIVALLNRKPSKHQPKAFPERTTEMRGVMKELKEALTNQTLLALLRAIGR